VRTHLAPLRAAWEGEGTGPKLDQRPSCLER
jgi:hypothetical protein